MCGYLHKTCVGFRADGEAAHKAPSLAEELFAGSQWLLGMRQPISSRSVVAPHAPGEGSTPSKWEEHQLDLASYFKREDIKMGRERAGWVGESREWSKYAQGKSSTL